MKKRIEDFVIKVYWCDRECQLAISQCLDLETTRAWLHVMIEDHFDRLQKEEE